MSIGKVHKYYATILYILYVAQRVKMWYNRNMKGSDYQMSERKAKWQNDYIAKKYDRINLVVEKGNKERIKIASDKNGESVTALINRVVMAEVEKIEKM